MKKRFLAGLLSTVMVMGLLAGCGGSAEEEKTATGLPTTSQTTGELSSGSSGGSTEAPKGGEFRYIDGFPQPSYDPHTEYHSWHSHQNGVTEQLFEYTEELEVVPVLADTIEIDGTVATIKLKDNICFSNGNKVTADMVKRNYERLGEVNARYAKVKDWTIEAKDDTTLVITTPTPNPILKNELAQPEFCIVDLDNMEEIDTKPIGTGPFKVESFVPDGDIIHVKNENYWGGEVILDRTVCYAMKDAQAKLMAMQNGEVEGYIDVAPADKMIFESDPETYDVYSVPTERRAYMYVNSNRLDDALREAIFLTVDRDAITAYLNGLASPCYGPFAETLPYGKSQQEKVDIEKAKQVLADGGYVLNGDTLTKDGKPVTLGIWCYASRSLDTMSVLIQDQLKAIGIAAEIKIVDDSTSTYMTDHEFDLGWYCTITNPTADPYQFIGSTLKTGSFQDVAGFANAETDKLIDALEKELDPDKRAELANEIIAQLNESHTCMFVCAYNKITVLKKGADALSPMHPYDNYQMRADSHL